jgi:hypothetical protein
MREALQKRSGHHFAKNPVVPINCLEVAKVVEKILPGWFPRSWKSTSEFGNPLEGL